MSTDDSAERMKDGQPSETAPARPARWFHGVVVYGGATLVVLATVGVVADTVVKVCSLQTPVPFGDTVDHLQRMEQYGLWRYLWLPVNEHIVFFPRVFFLLDYHLASATGRLLTALNLLFSLAIVVVFTVIARKQLFKDRGQALLYFCLLATAYVNATHTFTYTFGFMVQHWFTNLTLLLLAWTLSAGRDAPAGPSLRRWPLALALLGAAAAFSSGHGLLGFPVAAAIAVVFRFPWRWVVFFAAASLVLATIYMRLSPTSASGALQNILRQPLHSLKFFLAFLGSPYFRCDTIVWPSYRLFWTFEAWKALLLGATVFSAGALLVLHETLRRDTATRFSLFHSFVILLVFGVAVLAAGARLHMGVYEGTNPKYACTVLLLWISVFSLAIKVLGQYGALPRLHNRAAWLAAYAVLLTLALSAHFREPRAMSDWNRTLWRGASMMFAGVFDDHDYYLYDRPPEYLRYSQDVMRPRRLAFFHDYQFALGDRFDDWFTVESDPQLKSCYDSKTVVTAADPRGVRVIGWAWDERRARPPRMVVLVNSAGQIAGVAHAVAERDDVAAVLNDPRCSQSGWIGYARLREAAEPLTAYAVLDRSRRACLLGTR